jgi:hypothetical protein
MYFIIILILGTLPAFADSGLDKNIPKKLVELGIQIDPPKTTNKSWIHQFETLPLGEEMDHLEKMKNQRLNQIVSQ